MSKTIGLLPTPSSSKTIGQDVELLPLPMSAQVSIPKNIGVGVGASPPAFIPINEPMLRIEERYMNRAFAFPILSRRKANHLYSLLNKSTLSYSDKRQIKGQLLYYMFEPLLIVMLQYISAIAGKDMIIKGSYGLKLLLQENIRVNKSNEAIDLYNQLHTQDADIDIYLKDISKKDYFIKYIQHLIKQCNQHIQGLFGHIINHLYKQFLSYYPPTPDQSVDKTGAAFAITEIINEMMLYNGKAMYEFMFSQDSRGGVVGDSKREIYKLSIVDKPYDIVTDQFGNQHIQFQTRSGHQVLYFNPIMDCNFIVDIERKMELDKQLVLLQNEIIVNQLNLTTGITNPVKIIFNWYVLNLQYYFNEKKRLYCDLKCGDIESDEDLKEQYERTGLCDGVEDFFKENKIENQSFLCSKFGKQLKILSDSSLSGSVNKASGGKSRNKHKKKSIKSKNRNIKKERKPMKFKKTKKNKK